MLPLKDHSPTSKTPFISNGLITVNILVFLLMLLGDADGIIGKYALIPSQVMWNDYNTLLPFLTSQFLHGGFLHIISNLWFLKIFGDNVEEKVGHIKFLLFYLLCGIAGGLMQYFFSFGSGIPMLGASGAIAGVLGAYLHFFPHHKIETLIPFGIFSQVINLPAKVILVYWFITQLFSGVGTIASTMVGGIAFWAHIGGFAAGYYLASLYSRFFKSRLVEEGILLD